MRTIKYGDEGLYILYLQTLLERAGEDPGPADGIFGRKTYRALTAFQTQNGLKADGIAGHLTWAALYPYLVGCRWVVLTGEESAETLAERFHADAEAIRIANPNASFTAGETVAVPMRQEATFTTIPYSSFLTAAVIEGICLRYPFVVRETFGRSVTGSTMECVRFGNGTLKVGVNASHHANEWITTPLTLLFLERYAHAYAFDGEIGGVRARQLYVGSLLTLAPLVDPDGVDLVTGAIDPSDSFYQSAKALSGFYPNITFPDGWKANISGVDLNLGYPAGWEQARAIKLANGVTRPGPRDYVGTHPLEAPENRAMHELTMRDGYDRTVAFHTQGEEIYWQYMGSAPEGAEALARRFAAVSGYNAADVPFESGFAGYKDWFISEFGKPGFTIEAGKGTNPLPIDDLNAIYERIEGILVSVLIDRDGT